MIALKASVPLISKAVKICSNLNEIKTHCSLKVACNTLPKKLHIRRTIVYLMLVHKQIIKITKAIKVDVTKFFCVNILMEGY